MMKATAIRPASSAYSTPFAPSSSRRKRAMLLTNAFILISMKLKKSAVAGSRSSRASRTVPCSGAMRAFDLLKQDLGGLVLAHHGEGAAGHGPAQHLGVVRSGVHQERGAGAPDGGPEGLQALLLAEEDVEHDDVDAAAPECGEREGHAGRRAGHGHARPLAADQLRQAPQDVLVVFDEQHADGLVH